MLRYCVFLVHINMLMLRIWCHVMGWGGVGMLTFFETTQIRTRDLRDRRICKQVLAHVKSCMWRHNAGVNLWIRRLGNKTGLHETTQIPSKNGFMLPRLANSVKNEKRGFKPDVQIRGNSHISSRELTKKKGVFEGVANDAVALFLGQCSSW